MTRRLQFLIWTILLAAPLAAQRPAPGLLVAPLAGQPIPVLPLTYLTAESPVDEFLPGARTAQLAWADSILGEAFLSRGPEVDWLLPDKLRAVARRAPATVTDPDRMGQAVMRASGLDRVPDPLRLYLRSLSAMTNSRTVMIPAAVRFSPDSLGGVQAETSLVLVDTRNGSVLWRSNPVATRPTAAAALAATIANIFPDFR
ncbi:MAG: hypothetical protein SFU57_02805 [Gemmatimonadales bacterium]|nr:hypothetical protein [Gemmatimonadales bacterium]